MNKLLVSIALLVAACSSPTGVSSTVGVTVAQQVATQDPDVTTIEFVLTNTGRSTVYLYRCGENVMTDLERLVDGKWTSAGGDICLAIKEMHGIPLAPGTQLTGMRQVVGSGRFRLLTHVSPVPDLTRPERAVSAPFEID